MQKRTFTLLGLGAFGLTVVSFVLLGFGRLVLSYRTARYLSAPTMFLSFVLLVGLFVYSVLVYVGVAELE
ncbi:hypothetical protein [Haladaptatus sp. T7]|uniref:hypothetical protein n=1 Tax=Haladaptatus sp. T7 TaxID=2029368 RepID=UPI0021A255FB|nr:hypothetical protein [Haladaptatus sp. T7]GKZ13238.1 hypothetical protein HAL_11190 [Haladaptatus sp. T7]